MKLNKKLKKYNTEELEIITEEGVYLLLFWE